MSRRSGSPLRRVRQKMMARDPHCWYCGIEVIEVEHDQARRTRQAKPPNMATVEHLFHRLKGDRPWQGGLVLACNQCNNERNRYSERLAGIEVLHARSHRGALLQDAPGAQGAHKAGTP